MSWPVLDPISFLRADAVLNQVRIESCRAVFVLDEQVIVMGHVSLVVCIFSTTRRTVPARAATTGSPKGIVKSYASWLS